MTISQLQTQKDSEQYTEAWTIGRCATTVVSWEQCEANAVSQNPMLATPDWLQRIVDIIVVLCEYTLCRRCTWTT